MSNTFNMQRFLMLFKKHTKEHYKTHLMSLGVLTGILFIVFGYTAYVGGLQTATQEGFFAFFLVFGGCIYTSMVFLDLNQKDKALAILTLPVSSFERFLVIWIYSFVIFQIVFILCFYVVDVAVISIANSYAPYYERQKIIDFTSDDTAIYYIFLYSWFLQAVAFLGSIFFNKLHFVKSALALFGFVFILIFINQLLVRVIIDPNASAKVPFAELQVRDNTLFYYLEDSASKLGIVGVMFLAGTLCLWAAAYFKLKEKQV
jgi:hypothetical protein